MSKIFDSAKQPLVSSVLYVLLVTIIISTATYFLSPGIRENDLEMSAPLFFIAIMLTLNTFALPRLARFQDPARPDRPFTPMEVIVLAVIYIVVYNFLLIITTSGSASLKTSVSFASATFALCLSGVFLNYRIQTTQRRDTYASESVTDDDIRGIVQRTINSESFISALQTTLPKITKDTDAINHIPFILATLQERRKSFNRSSQLFFVALVAFSVLFTFLLTIYGFILIDSIPVGVGRAVQEVRAELKSFSPSQLEYEQLEQQYLRYETNFVRKTAPLLQNKGDASSYGQAFEDFIRPYQDRFMDVDPRFRRRITRLGSDNLQIRIEEYSLASDAFREAITKQQNKKISPQAEKLL